MTVISSLASSAFRTSSGVVQLDLHLHFKAFLLGGAADGDELLQHAPFALDQERVDAPGDVGGFRANARLVDA